MADGGGLARRTADASFSLEINSNTPGTCVKTARLIFLPLGEPSVNYRTPLRRWGRLFEKCRPMSDREGM
jgi:hypothetical protein